MSTLEELEKFMVAEVAVDLDKKSLDPDEDLLAQRILDSLGVMKLVMFLEKNFGIEVADEDIVPENFQSLNIMAKFVEHKMRSKSQ
jgi:acyl carrier protein